MRCRTLDRLFCLGLIISSAAVLWATEVHDFCRSCLVHTGISQNSPDKYDAEQEANPSILQPVREGGTRKSLMLVNNEQICPNKASSLAGEDRVNKTPINGLSGCKRKRPPSRRERKTIKVVAETLGSPLALTFSSDPTLRIDPDLDFRPCGLPRTADWQDKAETILKRRDSSFTRILNEEFADFDPTSEKPGRGIFSLIVAYFANHLSRELAREIENEAHFYLLKIPLLLRPLMSIPNEFLLPFTYSLLLMKPSYEHWKYLQSIFAKFCTRWTFSLITQDSFILEDTVEFKKMMTEKTAKMLRWISELLKNLFVPEFIEQTTSDRKNVHRTRKSSIGKPAHSITLPIQARLYEWFGFLDSTSKVNQARTGNLIIQGLIEKWQIDCHRGYPDRTSPPTGSGVVNKIKEGSMTLEVKQAVWRTWCRSIIHIQEAACHFEIIIKPMNLRILTGVPSLFHMREDFGAWKELSTPVLKGGDVIWGEFGNLFEAFQMKHSPELQKIIQQIPQIIWKPLGSCNTLAKLSYLFKLEDMWIRKYYFPDGISIFFNLDTIFGEELMRKFEDNFDKNQAIMDSVYKRNEAQRNRLKECKQKTRNLPNKISNYSQDYHLKTGEKRI